MNEGPPHRSHGRANAETTRSSLPAHRDWSLAAAARPRREAGVRADDFSAFWDYFEQLGGDRIAFLEGLSLSPTLFDRPNAVIPARITAKLFGATQTRMGHLAFGLELATKPQSLRMFGPLRLAMHNCRTLRHACEFYGEYLSIYCPALALRLRVDELGCPPFLQLDVLSGQEPDGNSQGIENFLLLVYTLIREISPGANASEVWFKHAPVASADVYHRHLETDVRFGMPMHGLRFDGTDFDKDLAGGDNQIIDMVRHFIGHEYRAVADGLALRLREWIEASLSSHRCTLETAAREMGMAPRTLQRQLRIEESSFEVIKDEVRRELALSHLRSGISLTEIAGMLGYSESSVLTRNCYRWFRNSPTKVRGMLRD